MTNCLEKLDCFCYVCGKHTLKEYKVSFFNSKVEDIYKLYFELEVFPNEPWVPKHICRICYNSLMLWSKGERNSMNFGIPMRWLEPGEHDETTCYVCQNSGVMKLNRHNRKNFVYKAVPSAMLPVTHSDMLPVPEPPVRSPSFLCEPGTTAETKTTVSNFSNFVQLEATTSPILMSQEHLNALVRKLGLSKNNAEILAADLKSLHMLEPGVNVTSFRMRQHTFYPFFTENETNTFVYCNDIEGLMNEMGIQYNPADWRIFIDSSQKSLKAVLLFYDNSKIPIPIAYGVNMKESYDSIKFILDVVKYEEHKWRACCDLKVVAFLSGMQSGYVKYPCFLCKWDSRWRGNQYAKKSWESRVPGELGEHNTIQPPLVPTEQILLPPLHIKLGVVKNFVKTIVKNGPALEFLKSLFPKLSEAKIKEGIFVGPDIRKLMQNAEFDLILSPNELTAWKSVKDVISNVLGKCRSPSAQTYTNTMLQEFEKLGVHMSTKIHFLNSHMDFFENQLSTESDEHGERFHQVCLPVEERYKGKSILSLITDLCWTLFDNGVVLPRAKKSNLNTI